jgi:hypothetical protein
MHLGFFFASSNTINSPPTQTFKITFYFFLTINFKNTKNNILGILVEGDPK